MTDRELLELAAKAAGIEYDKNASFPPDGKTYSFFGLWLVIHGEPYEGQRRRWNPLTDDGDALRLAVKLNIQITPGTYNKDEFTAFKAAGGEAHEFRHYQQDEYAATRRAIVRAAAEIGLSMEGGQHGAE